MASRKVISVNESSLVDLKAELYRKETLLKREKVDNSQPKKAPIWQKKKKESKRKDGKTIENTTSTDNSYDKELEKSRMMLEAKSALYNKLSNGEIEVPSDEEEEGRFLVDFHQKTFPKKVDNEDENIIEHEEIPPAPSPDEEWVDYVDSFGRSRKCLRKDLPQMKDKDEKMKSLEGGSKQTLLSDDMRRELIRKKWEQEVQEALDKPVGPVHYQDIFFDETRDHGVGYYKFSKVEEEREEQQTAFNKMRAQTEQQRSKREKLLEKRKAAMDARLAKIRARKQRKLHEQGAEEHVPEEHEQGQHEDKTENISNIDEDETTNDEEMIGSMVERIRNKSSKINHMNEWEKRKIDLEIFDKPKRPSYEPGSERNPEFAPPSLYTNEKKSFAKKTKWKEQEKRRNVEIPNECGKSDNKVTFTTPRKPEHNNQPDVCSNYSSQYSTEWTTPPQTSITQKYQPPFDNTLSNVQNTNYHVHNTHPNVHNTLQDTNPNLQSTNTNLYNTLPNLPPPPIHTFPPPNLPPPPIHAFPPPNLPIHTYPPSNLPPPLSYEHPLQPQYPLNIPYTPNYPPPSFINQQYHVTQ